jgi:hypothetical protein
LDLDEAVVYGCYDPIISDSGDLIIARPPTRTTRRMADINNPPSCVRAEKSKPPQFTPFSEMCVVALNTNRD